MGNSSALMMRLNSPIALLRTYKQSRLEALLMDISSRKQQR